MISRAQKLRLLEVHPTTHLRDCLHQVGLARQECRYLQDVDYLSHRCHSCDLMNAGDHRDTELPLPLFGDAHPSFTPWPRNELTDSDSPCRTKH